VNRFSPLRHAMEKGSGDEDIIKVNQSALSKTEVKIGFYPALRIFAFSAPLRLIFCCAAHEDTTRCAFRALSL